MSSPSNPKPRYDALQAILDQALAESKQAVDARQTVKECYGNEGRLFGEEMLANFIDTMLNKANEKVRKEMISIYEEEKVPQTLAKVDSLEDRIRQERQAKERAETDDKTSTQEAMKKSLLPEGVTARDVLNYHTYQTLTAERDAMRKELEKIREENERLVKEQESTKSAVDERVEQVATVVKAFEKTADMYSMVS